MKNKEYYEELIDDLIIDINKKDDSVRDKAIYNFIEYTKSNEIIVIILKSHLYLENAIDNMLINSYFSNKFIKNMKFSDKLYLANNFGLMLDFYNTIKMINDYRNNYAHNLNFNFTENDYQRIISTLPKIHKDGYEKCFELKDTILAISYNSLPKLNFSLQLLFLYIWNEIDSYSDYADTIIFNKIKLNRCNKVNKYLEDVKHIKDV